MGDRARLPGLNIVGLQRRGFSRDEIQALRTAYQMLFEGESAGTMAERVDEVAEALSRRAPVRERDRLHRASNRRAA